MRFSKLFSIDISHGYFKSGVCNDVLVQPTEQCNRLLKKYRLTGKFADGNISVLANSNGGNEPILKPEENTSFDFYISVLNTDFISYSDLPAKKSEEVYSFNNKNVSIQNGSLSVSSIGKINKTQGGKPLLGVIQIFFPATFPAAYTLHLNAAEATWKYYLVTDSNLKNLSINGTLAGVGFNKNKNAEDKIIEAMTDRFPGANLFVFESQLPIAYSESGKKDIQLINTDKNNILINHLPNPCYKRNGIQIINIIN